MAELHSGLCGRSGGGQKAGAQKTKAAQPVGAASASGGATMLNASWGAGRGGRARAGADRGCPGTASTTDEPARGPGRSGTPARCSGVMHVLAGQVRGGRIMRPWSQGMSQIIVEARQWWLEHDRTGRSTFAVVFGSGGTVSSKCEKVGRRGIEKEKSAQPFWIARIFLETWCPGEDSNLHALRHTDLNRARLPVPPPGPVS